MVCYPWSSSSSTVTVIHIMHLLHPHPPPPPSTPSMMLSTPSTSSIHTTHSCTLHDFHLHHPQLPLLWSMILFNSLLLCSCCYHHLMVHFPQHSTYDISHSVPGPWSQWTSHVVASPLNVNQERIKIPMSDIQNYKSSLMKRWTKSQNTINMNDLRAQEKVGSPYVCFSATIKPVSFGKYELRCSLRPLLDFQGTISFLPSLTSFSVHGE
jgi:hypothetical protein